MYWIKEGETRLLHWPWEGSLFLKANRTLPNERTKRTMRESLPADRIPFIIKEKRAKQLIVPRGKCSEAWLFYISFTLLFKLGGSWMTLPAVGFIYFFVTYGYVYPVRLKSFDFRFLNYLYLMVLKFIDEKNLNI